MKNAIWMISMVVCLGCGGAQEPADEAEPQPSAGGQQTADAEPMTEEMEEPAAAPAGGPVSLTVTTVVKGQAVSGRVKLVDASGQVAAEGSTGQTMRVPSGSYTAEVQVTDEGVLIDKPTQTLEMELVPGTEVKEKVIFPWCRVRLNVRVRGNLDRNARVKLMRHGTVVAEIKSASDYVPISPGHYAAEVTSRKTVTRLDDVMLPEGATRDVPIDVTF
jgi:hypothetical protein